MSDATAEKAQIRAYNEITRADYTPESIEAAIGKLWDTAIASRDAEAAAYQAQIGKSFEEFEAERTRADKAETSLTNLEAGFKSFMRSHNQVLDENERLREVIKQVRAWNEHTDFIGLETIIAAAVPVEPQGEVDTTRERIARNGDMVLRGQGVISDRNGPFRLSLKVDGIWQPVVLNTYDWNVGWAEPHTPDHENGPR